MSSSPRFDSVHQQAPNRAHPQTQHHRQPPPPNDLPPPLRATSPTLLPHLAASPSPSPLLPSALSLLPPLSPASSPQLTPTPHTPAKLLLLQLALVCENAAQTSRRASETGGHLRPEDVVSLRESLTAAGFFFGQLHASTAVTAAVAGGRSVSPALAPSPSPSPSPVPMAHGGSNCSTFCPSVSTAFSPSSTSASLPITPMLSLGLSSIARYSSPILSCPSPSSSPSPMSSPRPSTSAPSSIQHNNNNANANDSSSMASLHQQLNHSLCLIGASSLLDLGTPSSSPTLSQASPDVRGLPLGIGPFHAPRVCVECGRESSIQWRSGPMGSSTLCNACGMRYMRKRKKEEKKRSLLEAAQGDRSGKQQQQNNNSSKRRNHNKRAKITHPRAASEPQQQADSGSTSEKQRRRHTTKSASASASSSSSSSEGEEDAGAGASHRASLNFLLN